MFQKISAREMVRRLRHMVGRGKSNIVFVLGAGCSASSGVPTAAEAVRRWLSDLIYLETGKEIGVEEWAERRFPGYRPDNPAAVYGMVFHALHHTEEDRWRGLERLVKDAEPGFGYGTLAQLMTHEKWGARCYLAITTNIDELAGDALQIFGRRRGQSLSSETLTERSKISASLPTVVNIHGDAHLPGREARLPEPARERLRRELTDALLVFIGYGGREECVLDLLSGLPKDAPHGGVYWVNEAPPPDALAQWLAPRRAFWAVGADFDEAMYFLRLEFGLSHPETKRYERIYKRYLDQYSELSQRGRPSVEPETRKTEPSGEEPDELRPAEDAAPEAEKPTEDAVTQEPSVVDEEAARRAAQKAREDEVATLREGARYALEELDDVKTAERMLTRALNMDLRNAETLRLLAWYMLRACGEKDEAENCLRLALEVGPTNVAAMIDYARFLDVRRGRLDAAEAHLRHAAALETAEPAERVRAGAELAMFLACRLGDLEAAEAVLFDAATLAFQTAPDRNAATHAPLLAAQAALAERKGELDAAEALYAQATAAQPGDERAQIGFARFLETRRRNPAAAEERLTEAIKARPRSAPPYAALGRLLDRLGERERAEAMHGKAVGLEPHDPDALIALAQHLAEARDNTEKADKAFQAALVEAPRSAAALCAYGRFLRHGKGDLDAAEQTLQRAVDVEPRNVEALLELASFFHKARNDAWTAEAAYREAVRIAPGHAVARDRLAAFLRAVRRRSA